MKNNTQGFTLIELLITLSIASILLSQALPSFNQFLDQRKVSAHTQRLAQVIKLSRTVAVTESQIVTLCPTQNGHSCSANWSDGYLSFKDDNGNRQLDHNEEKLFEYLSTDKNSQVSWRAFGVRKSLQWLQTGITNHQNGSFELCYKSIPELSRGLFITKPGRIRYSKDNNGDGIHENATGGVIRC